jgi:alpha,alpha-trehalase
MDHKQVIKSDPNIQKALDSAESLMSTTITDTDLPNPFVPTSSGIFREQYYWDSFFIMQGLKEKGKEGMKIGRDMVENFFFLFDKYGLIPNSSKNFTTRSQPPLLSSMILMVDKWQNDKEWLKNALEIARQEYKSVWLAPLHLTKTGLSRYRDQISPNGKAIDAENESGWDFTPRFQSRTNHICPVDLNSLLYKYEKDFESISKKLGDDELSKKFKTKSETRRDIINEYLWNDDNGFYFDYNFVEKKQLDTKSLAAYVPLWVGCADANQAKQLVDKLKWFEYEGGLAVTDQNYGSDAQWSHPNGWPPLMWLVIKGLRNYGFDEDANRLTYKWLKLCADKFKKTSEWHEKFDVTKKSNRHDDKRYPHQTQQFWTMGVFISLYKDILK